MDFLGPIIFLVALCGLGYFVWVKIIKPRMEK
jgi:hypothetical protein